MLKNTLKWRKSVAYMNGVDREGHPVCYNIYGTFGTEEKRNQFLRWRFQLMEEGIQKLDFKQGGNSPGPSKKELRIATKQAVGLLQDNYPEFVARNIFINVPFWYYAFSVVLSPFLTHRTKSKFVFACSSKVAGTLLKYIPAENIPIQFGGLKRENDSEFSVEDGIVSELLVKNGGKETVETPVPEIGSTAIWDLLGWEVSYKNRDGGLTLITRLVNLVDPSSSFPCLKNSAHKSPILIFLFFYKAIRSKLNGLYRAAMAFITHQEATK
ncbi:hypothetical protein NE237_009174 [Protea cynaroides]|uniref:CRAL-TRIO domain-containing protein n=1 Tax=Protea cynaroides TaxID=273540 RepID=A0A9Q0KXF6_9MAGN|nr:hypothetical protein NE237_009174 [Protea cynaroides]